MMSLRSEAQVEMDTTWEEIEQSESYLVCSMYDEAASLASSVLKRLHDNSNEVVDDNQLHDILESAGMVLVQSLERLGRASEILKELQILFPYAATIPVKVLLTGVCFQLSKGSSFGVREILEEFLSKWVYVVEGYYILVGVEENAGVKKGFSGNYQMGIDLYMEVVELYAVTVLGKVMKDVKLATSWVEKAALPNEKQQELFRKLNSLDALNANNVLKDSSTEDKHVPGSYVKDPITEQPVLKLSGQGNPYFRWLKFAKAWLLVSNGKIALSLLIFLLFFVLRRRRATLVRSIKRQVLGMKKGLVDLWELAFSYQVNPLAAVQSLPTAPRGGQ